MSIKANNLLSAGESVTRTVHKAHQTRDKPPCDSENIITKENTPGTEISMFTTVITRKLGNRKTTFYQYLCVYDVVTKQRILLVFINLLTN